MSDFRYYFGSLRTEQVIAEIPVYGVYMDMEMNSGGTFQGTFQLDQTGQDNDTLMSACLPGKCWVACERDGIAIWHGYIWSRVYSAQSKTVQLFAQSFDKYPTKRLVLKDYDFDNVEQRNIFRTLWTDIQSTTGGNLNVNLPPAFASGRLKDLEVLETDNRFYSEVISEIADPENGFDWYVSITKDGQLYRKDMRIGFPNLGTVVNPGMVVFDYPGNITQYYSTESMAEAGTHIYVFGNGEGSDVTIGSYVNNTLISGGWPRWDVAISRKDITSQSSVDGAAAQYGLTLLPPMNVLKLTVKSNLTPVFGSYNLGDTCGISIRDPRYPNGFRANKRLLRWELKPQSSESVEEANLVFEGDPDV